MPATRRHFPPGDLDELVDDIIYEITDRPHLLPENQRVRSFRREQRRPGRRFPRQKDPAKVPLPPRTTIIFWLMTPPETSTADTTVIPIPTPPPAPATRPQAA